eukprot:TRINITY_DN3374_c0_g2_i1.p1 TRINITY_DN3374_c0_g2~~TRINITY_DN3374_c0_g2_i1.p1  ORF type:complete len:478 (-),score=167.55 TRINITY_DN3374_c0_g2_i1:101-1534(-)
MPTLIVEVVAARNLAPRGSTLLSPMVKVTVRRPGTSKDAKKRKTKAQKKTLDPVFKELFTFTEVNPGDELIMECWNTGKASFLGQVFIKLDKSVSDRAGKFSEWMSLRDRGESKDGDVSGELFVELLMSRESSVLTRSDGSVLETQEDTPPRGSPSTKKKFGSLRGKGSPLQRKSHKRQLSLGDQALEEEQNIAKFGASASSVTLTRKATPVLGVKLEELMERQKDKHPQLMVPSFCQRALNELTKRDAHLTEGIFRLEANNEELERALSQGNELRFSKLESVHTIAGVLKIFLRELPEPVLSYFFYAQFVESVDATAELPAPRLIKRAIEKLPTTNYHLLRRIIKFAHKITKCYEQSKMDSTNISIVLGPNLLWREKKRGECLSGEQDLLQYRTSLAVATKLVSFIIDEYPNIFPNPMLEVSSAKDTGGSWIEAADGSLYCVTEEEVEVEYDENGNPIEGHDDLIVEVIEEVIEYE